MYSLFILWKKCLEIYLFLSSDRTYLKRFRYVIFLYEDFWCIAYCWRFTMRANQRDHLFDVSNRRNSFLTKFSSSCYISFVFQKVLSDFLFLMSILLLRFFDIQFEHRNFQGSENVNFFSRFLLYCGWEDEMRMVSPRGNAYRGWNDKT